jgi:hypothetical protein
LAGSDAAGVRQGSMSLDMAKNIIMNMPYVEDNFTPNGIAHGRLQNMLNRLFPGLEIIQHMGNDLPLRAVNYVPFIEHADELTGILVQLYALKHLPRHVKVDFVLICCHLANMVSLNPNTFWTLWSNTIIQDSIAIQMKSPIRLS